MVSGKMKTMDHSHGGSSSSGRLKFWMRRRSLWVVCASGWLLTALVPSVHGEETMKEVQPQAAQMERATFAGGCFWCMQPPYDKLPGVMSTTVGYTGGTKPNPTYDEVCTGTTGHAEAVQIVYDPAKITYEQLLDVFWKNIDPTTVNQQFVDAGSQYRTAIFYHTDEQRRLAEESKHRLQESGKFRGQRIATEIVPASAFYPAEAYHQQYYKQCPLDYQRYRAGSGRAAYLDKTWGNQSH